jgi:DNA-binding transcriptional MerR regulator
VGPVTIPLSVEAANGDLVSARHSTRPPGSPRAEYSIDELAARSNVPSRTIRFYRSQGLLPASRRRGRSAVYGEQHVERLELIARLRDRGLNLRTIRDLLERGPAPGVSIDDWLGIQDRLGAPWSEDRPRVVDEPELEDLLGERPAGTLAELIRIGAVQREKSSPGHYRMPSPGLLAVTLRLLDAGIDLETAGTAAAAVRRHLARAVVEVLDALSRRAGRGFGRRGTAGDLARAIEGIRPVAADAVRLIFVQELERGLRGFIERGGRPAARRKGRRRR